jgi:hypothetical protein
VRTGHACLLAVAAALLGAVPAAATTSREAVDFLNQQRAANQIPANVELDAARTQGCANHNKYMQQNGLQHGEEPGKPGYTPEGADYNDTSEVVAQGVTGWTAAANPWDAAPLHQTILFDPTIASAGYDENGGFACMRLRSVFDQTTTPLLYAYTGNLGRTDVPPTVVVQGEGPYAPQEAVGIPQGVPTGPNILFFTTGFGQTNHAVSFSLTGPDGAPVDAKMVDSTTPPPAGQSYRPFRRGGDLIAVDPLDPFTDYTATVTWHNDDTGAEMPQTVSFRTAGFLRGLKLTLSRKLSRKRRATLKAPAEAVGQTATVKIGAATSQRVLKRKQRLRVPRRRGRRGVLVTVTVPSFTSGDTRFTVERARRRYR